MRQYNSQSTRHVSDQHHDTSMTSWYIQSIMSQHNRWVNMTGMFRSDQHRDTYIASWNNQIIMSQSTKYVQVWPASWYINDIIVQPEHHELIYPVYADLSSIMIDPYIELQWKFWYIDIASIELLVLLYGIFREFK